MISMDMLNLPYLEWKYIPQPYSLSLSLSHDTIENLLIRYKGTCPKVIKHGCWDTKSIAYKI